MKIFQIVKDQVQKVLSRFQPANLVKHNSVQTEPAVEKECPVDAIPAPADDTMPTPAQKSQLVDLFNAGRFAELETQASALVGQFPESGFAWSILSASLHLQGKDALNALQMTAKLMPDAAPAHNNLGNALQERGQLEDALLAYRRALEINPGLAEAHSNLGNVLLDLGRLDAAMASFHQAIEIKRDFAIAHMNLGLVLGALGQLDEAVASCRRALAFQPQSGEFHYALGNALCDAGDIEQAILAYQQALAIDPHHHGLSAAVWLAVRYYLKGDLAACQDMLDTSAAIKTKSGRKLAPISLYRDYLALLVDSQRQRQDTATANQELSQLFVIGESHSLATHGMRVPYCGQALRCCAQWIEGCKQWHLGNQQANLYKSKFQWVLASLPKRSTILLIFGEIDCRPNEGMIKASTKSGAKSLQDIAQATAKAYVAYLTQSNRPFEHRMIVCGVPASNLPADTLPTTAAQQHVELLRMFNGILKQETLVAGLDFVDVHTLTDRGDGMASGDWHIDAYHLQPQAIAAAFERLCIVPPTSSL